MSPPAVQAVLFDLDDTLIDFQYSRRHGLRTVQELLPGLAPVPLEELELVHDEELHANYLRTLDGSLSDDEARLERMRGICRRYGVQADEKAVAGAAGAYAREQQSNPRLVPGAPELLEALRGRVRIGVVTNGPSGRQRDKLEICDIRTDGLDALAISEEVGAAKPDPAIFRHALSGLGVAPERVTMVGIPGRTTSSASWGAAWPRSGSTATGATVQILRSRSRSGVSSRSGMSCGFWECGRDGVEALPGRISPGPYPWRERSSSAPRHIATSFR